MTLYNDPISDLTIRRDKVLSARLAIHNTGRIEGWHGGGLRIVDRKMYAVHTSRAYSNNLPTSS